MLKTEAIDTSRPFLWLDDQPLASEVAWLEERGLGKSLLVIDLPNEPDALLTIAQILPTTLRGIAT